MQTETDRFRETPGKMSEEPIGELSPSAPRRRLPLYALYSANAISRVGDVLTLLALPWFTLQTTGSLTKTGLVGFCATVAVAVTAFFGGALVDRAGFKRVSVVSDLASAICSALIPLLYYTVGLQFWQLLTLVFLAGLGTTPGSTARSALVPDLAELAGARLERVSAATDGVSRVAGFIGAPLAGLLIVLIGASNLLWIDAATFAVSAALIGLLVPVIAIKPAPVSNRTEVGQPASKARRYLADLNGGVGFLLRDGMLFSMTVTVLVTNLLDAGFGAVLGPGYIRLVYGNAVLWGAMIAGFGGAAFLGTVVFGAIGHRLPRQLTLGIGFTLAGGTRYLALALIHSPIALVVINIIAGFFIAPVNPLFDTVSYERIPATLRARVFGVITAGATVGMPLGALISGYLGAWLGLRTTLLLLGTIYVAMTASLLVNPTLRGMEKQRKSDLTP
ncbi:MAG TPA: MFS transporter [Ktedonobacterales bacterium]|nr:MFS transporter [Ktedonobacterales bacterium]